MENFLKIYELFVNHQDDEKFENKNTNKLIMTGEFDVGSTPKMSEDLSKCIKNSKNTCSPKNIYFYQASSGPRPATRLRPGTAGDPYAK